MYVYRHPVFACQTPEDVQEDNYTEVCLIVDGRCPLGEMPNALDKAADYMAEELRIIVDEIDPCLMFSATVLDRISMCFADAIEKYNGEMII